LKIALDQGRVSVYPTALDLLLQCQFLFYAWRPNFSPHQVFIAILKLPRKHELEEELQYLMLAMQSRLFTASIYDSDEGCFIRIAIGFVLPCLISRKTVVQHQATPSELMLEAKVNNIKQIEPGIWRIEFILLCSSMLISKQGSISKLAQSFSYKPSTDPPMEE
jgi:hypothetical protein